MLNEGANGIQAQQLELTYRPGKVSSVSNDLIIRKKIFKDNMRCADIIVSFLNIS